MEKTINLTIDKKTYEEYEDFYFKAYPRRKVFPFKQIHHPSVNQWMIMKRPQMNNVKQQWKDFIVWFVEKCRYTNLQIGQCEMIFVTYFKTKQRHDVDNTVPKFLLDGLVEAGFIKDDDSSCLKSLTLQCGYDKENPRIDITIKYI